MGKENDGFTEETIGTIDTTEMKRCYIPGAKIETACPKCGAKFHRDFDDEYLMNPGEREQVSFFCDKCEENYLVNIKIEVKVKIKWNPEFVKD